LMPDVAVIIPTRGRSQLLGTTLHCALNQVGVELEVIVVDDGSTDDTAALLKRHDDDRLRVLRNDTPQGVSAARNRGIAHARSRWVAFLDDDDLWAPDKLSAQLEAAESAGRGWVYTGDVNVDRDLRVLSGAPPPPPDEVVRSLRRYNAIPAGASNVVVRADHLERVGVFDPGLRRTEDWDLWIRLARTGPPAWVPRPLVGYTVHRSGASRNMPKMIQELDLIASRYDIPIDLAAHYRWAAWSHLVDGERGAALRYYRRAVLVGDLPSLGRMVVALLSPGAARRRLRRERLRQPDSAWSRQAQGWLEALERDTAGGAGDVGIDRPGGPERGGIGP
jgi:glycosyltransferase involved in cell wall biosynthesis